MDAVEVAGSGSAPAAGFTPAQFTLAHQPPGCPQFYLKALTTAGQQPAWVFVRDINDAGAWSETDCRRLLCVLRAELPGVQMLPIG